MTTSELHKWEVLVDALPMLQRYSGKILVVKYGGSAMEEKEFVDKVLRDVALLRAVGIQLVVIHGGGKLITERMRAAGILARFVQGLRVTNADAIRIVTDVLTNVINPEIVRTLVGIGAPAVGVAGQNVISARKVGVLQDKLDTGSAPVSVDIGFVGEVEKVNTKEIRKALADGKVPVVTPLGGEVGKGDVILNINADIAASAIAADLKAAKLVFISDVQGLMRDLKVAETLIPSIHCEQIRELIADGTIQGGMLPKVESASRAIDAGVGSVHFIEGRRPHALLEAVLGQERLGTEILP